MALCYQQAHSRFICLLFPNLPQDHWHISHSCYLFIPFFLSLRLLSLIRSSIGIFSNVVPKYQYKCPIIKTQKSIFILNSNKVTCALVTNPFWKKSHSALVVELSVLSCLWVHSSSSSFTGLSSFSLFTSQTRYFSHCYPLLKNPISFFTHKFIQVHNQIPTTLELFMPDQQLHLLEWPGDILKWSNSLLNW